MSRSSRRHAEIAGAGFAGLTAATALRQRGWSVRVHERSPELREFGAGIVVFHNGIHVLRAIGAYEMAAKAWHNPPFYETRLHNHSVSKETFGPVEWRTLTRQDLYRSILSAAERAGVEIVTNSEIVSADPSGTLTTANGTTYSADLVVGADGVGSKVRDSIGFRRTRRRYTDGIIRFLVPRHKEALGPGEWDNVIDFWHLSPRPIRILYVPCNERDLYVALMAPRADKRGSRVPIDLDLWLEFFPFLEPVIRSADGKEGRYDGYQTTLLEQWSQGRVALVGDSAHAMCPALAQGAGCAMMNALALAVHLERERDVPTALRIWETSERGVTDRCQQNSAYFAHTRSMSKGNQFTWNMLEAARYTVGVD